MDEQDLTIHKLFSGIAGKFPERAALQIKQGNQWEVLSYGELETLSLRLAAFLLKQGLKKNDRAALILENRLEWPAIYLGMMYAGITCVPLDPELTRQELQNLIADSAVKAIFASFDIFSEKIQPVIAGLSIAIIVLDAPGSARKNFINFQDALAVEPDKNILPEVYPQDLASLIYTSGTTAEPKGVLLTHKNFCSNFKSIEKLNICLASDNFLSVLPLYHAYAFTVTLITPLLLGAKVTYFDLKRNPQELNSVIKEARVTMLVGVPQIFAMLHKAILDKINKVPSFLRPLVLPFTKNKLRSHFGPSLRLLVSGGARLEPKIGRGLTEFGFKIIEGFGLTETAPIVTINPPEKVKFGSAGKSIPDVSIKIAEPDASGEGEVLIKGPNVMQGYFKRPELTAQAIKDSWFYSGDSGFIDQDGFLFLTGRLKDVIVLSSGKNVYPEELEAYYGRSPYIKEICIFAKPEQRFGNEAESLYAVIVPDFEYFRQKSVLDIRGKLRWELENLAVDLPAYKHIMGFSVAKEDLPRTALKKIKRYQVREKYLEETMPQEEFKTSVISEEDAGILTTDVGRKVMDYIARELKKPVRLDSHLEIDLGIDSLSRVQLQLGLEECFRLKIPGEVFSNLSTVKEVIIAILDLTKKQVPAQGRERIAQEGWSQILKQLPEKEILNKIRIESSFLDKLVTWIFKCMFQSLFRVFWLLRIEGRDNLPGSGPYIICPNHASYLDGLIVVSGLKFRLAVNTFFLGHSGILQHPLISWGMKLGRLIPVDTDTRLTEAMQTVSFVLQHKKIVCIFAEGGRSVDENIAEFKKGVGILMKELEIPAVPVYIKGSHMSWPRTKRLPGFHPVKIIFGKPVTSGELINRVKSRKFSDDYEAIASGLREEVVKLS